MMTPNMRMAVIVIMLLVIGSGLMLLSGCQVQPAEAATAQAQAGDHPDANTREFKEGYQDALMDVEKLIDPVGLKLILETKRLCEKTTGERCYFTGGFVPESQIPPELPQNSATDPNNPDNTNATRKST